MLARPGDFFVGCCVFCFDIVVDRRYTRPTSANSVLLSVQSLQSNIRMKGSRRDMSFTCDQIEMRAVPFGHASARGPVSAVAGLSAVKPWAAGISTQCAFVSVVEIDGRDGRHMRRGTWRGGV